MLVSLLDQAQDVDFIVKTAIERDPNKRRVKPVEQACSILDFDEEESSDDSDFRIEDHAGASDDDDADSLNSGADSGGASSSAEGAESDDDESDEIEKLEELRNLNASPCGVADVIERANRRSQLYYNEQDATLLICCGCLGDHSDGVNEIVECDSCGVTVHEACYGVADSTSVGSTNSLSPTAPWFCETCKAGVKDPVCELCPNSGGIFKETDVGKWVHLICALYVPGVAFGEVDKLTSVTLFEMPYSKWGAKTCSLCPDERFARTGVCIGCDAGMCRTYFHVTCAQREGFLSEAHTEEVDQADPFYAHCKLHSDKTLVKRRKRNYQAWQMRARCRQIHVERAGHADAPDQLRIRRKLAEQRGHYAEHKRRKMAPWVPTQKMPRLITTSAAACRKLLRKAELMGIDTIAMATHEAQLAALMDVRKKWHIPPAFTVEFIAYYLDRNERLKDMKTTLDTLLAENKQLLDQQQSLRATYDQVLKRSQETAAKTHELKSSIQKYHSAILSACPTKATPNIDDIGKPATPRPSLQPMTVPTAAALKMGVGFPLARLPNRGGEEQAPPLQLNECGICRQRRDQHLLAKCDTCHLYYHTDCLNPPLSRLPKKSKLYGWQCSECDKTSDSEVEEMKTPRRSRSVYSRDRGLPTLKIKPVEEPAQQDAAAVDLLAELGGNDDIEVIMEPQHKSSKKRRREKHRNRYSPDLGKEHRRKRKKRSVEVDAGENLPHPRITIKIKSIPLPAGEVASESNPQCFYVPNEADDNAPPPFCRPDPLALPLCDVCGLEGGANTAVKCDECQKMYHFSCLEPPLKTSPKKRGYSWHCAECDPTGSE